MDPMHGARRLIVMRHAKAGELPGGPDAERALAPRGQRDAASAGKWLRDQGYIPDTVICSTARRARQTWRGVSAELPAPVEAQQDPRLYEAGAGDLVEIIGAVAPATATLMYVGHNPAAQNLASFLLGRPVGFPTAAIAVIGLAAPWADLAPGGGELVASWAPAPRPAG
jgi:phosphohistidine phosphatase